MSHSAGIDYRLPSSMYAMRVPEQNVGIVRDLDGEP